MKFNDIFQVLNTIDKAISDPTFFADSLKKSQLFSFSNTPISNSNTNNNIYTNAESNSNQYIETVPPKDYKSPEDNANYNNYENNDYYNKQKADLSKEEGLLDSITQELTSARLQQAIILSEIVGKPKSKTRKRRRF